MFNFSSRSAFIIRFLVTYILLSWVYQFYLSCYGYSPDPFTSFIADVVFDVLASGYDNIETVLHPRRASIRFLHNRTPLFQIVEGCNAISICIIFVSFINAFSKFSKRSIIFSLIGITAVLVTNIFRISALGVLYIKKYAFVNIIHDTIFPASIYGFIVLLWLIWIKLEGNSSKNE